MSSSRKATFTQSELARVLKAHRDADIPVVRTEVLPNGTIKVYTINSQAAASDDDPNPWDAE